MGDRTYRTGPDGQLIVTDTRTLAEARAENRARVLQLFGEALANQDDSPAREGAQWLALGMLRDNAGTAFASWPAAQRTLWNNQVQPNVDAVSQLLARLRTARQAIAAATTREAADAVPF